MLQTVRDCPRVKTESLLLCVAGLCPMILGDEKGGGGIIDPSPVVPVGVELPPSPRILVSVRGEYESLRYFRYRRGTTLGSQFLAVHICPDLSSPQSFGSRSSITLIYQSCVLSFWRIKIAFRLGKRMKGRLHSITLISIGQIVKRPILRSILGDSLYEEC